MNYFPIWDDHVEECLVNHDADVALGSDSGCYVVVLCWDKFVHVRHSNANSASSAKTDAKVKGNVEINALREKQNEI